jgi:hypothetical protein
MILLTLLIAGLHLLGLGVHHCLTLVAEKLFLLNQLALYHERHVGLRHTTDVTRIAIDADLDHISHR